MILHKIRQVDDSVCKGTDDNKPCFHLYDGECRAFEMPHSKDEEEQRKQGRPKCEPWRRRH